MSTPSEVTTTINNLSGTTAGQNELANRYTFDGIEDKYQRIAYDMLSFDLIGKGASATTEYIVSDLGSALAEQTLTLKSGLTISSGSTADVNTSGTGAWTVQVTGLDSNYNEINETVNLNGQTGVTLANSYMFVSKIAVLTAGTGGYNAGIIYLGSGTITTGVPATKYLSIPPIANISRVSAYCVPAGKNLVIKNICANASSSIVTTYRYYAKPFGGVYQLRLSYDLYNTAANFPMIFTLPEKTLFKITSQAASGTPTATVLSNAYLVSNS